MPNHDDFITFFCNPDVHLKTMTKSEFNSYVMKGHFVICFLSFKKEIDESIHASLKDMLVNLTNKLLVVVDDLDKQLDEYFKIFQTAEPTINVLFNLIQLMTSTSGIQIRLQQVSTKIGNDNFYWTFIGNPPENMTEEKIDGYLDYLREKMRKQFGTSKLMILEFKE